MDAPLGFHSLADEVATDPPVEGSLPDWLDGSLLRNGPGSFRVGDGEVDHWFDGLAMVHRFAFDGAADRVRYRNRFLRTDAFAAARAGEFDGGFATGETTLRDRLRSFFLEPPYDNANVVVERVGERYLALTESPRWVELDPATLATRGEVRHDRHDVTGDVTCAHMHRDPATDRLVTFDVDFGRPSRYRVYELADPGEPRPVAAVPVDEPAYMHSFALTPNYVVLTEFPLVVDPLTFLKPGRQGPFIDAYRWEPERGTRFLVVDRAGGDVVARPRGEPRFGFHHVNAYEDGDELVLDVETMPDATSIETLSLSDLRAGSFEAVGGRIERFRLDLGASPATVESRVVHGGATSLPTVSRARWLAEHRYVWAQGADQPVTGWPDRVEKLDVETGGTLAFDAVSDHFSEPVFVPRPGGDREDDGVVLTVGLDRDAGRSWLHVLDGETMTERARARLPHAVPFDFHGRYFPELGVGADP